MPRTYTPRARAVSMARTRERIIETTRRMAPKEGALAVHRIAAESGVSVQTLYTHFGWKRGLLLAVIDSTQRDVGLSADFDHVWSSPDGETALRRMVEATIRLWHGAWDLVRVRGGAPERAGAIAVHAAVASVVDQSIPPVTGPPADWSQVLKDRDVIDLATAPRVETDG